MSKHARQKAQAEKRQAFQKQKAWKHSSNYLKGPKKKSGRPATQPQAQNQPSAQVRIQSPAPVRRVMPDLLMPEFERLPPGRRITSSLEEVKDADGRVVGIRSRPEQASLREEEPRRPNNGRSRPRFESLSDAQLGEMLVRHHIAYQGKSPEEALAEDRRFGSGGLIYIKSRYEEGRI